MIEEPKGTQENETVGSELIERLGGFKRFECISDPQTDHPTMEETEIEGDWVRWDDAKVLLDRVAELEAKVLRMKTDNGYPTYEDMRMAEAGERRRLVPIVYQWAFPNSKLEQQVEDMKELAEAMGVQGGDWNRERGHIAKAMELMRDSGANEREYIVYATLSAGLDA